MCPNTYKILGACFAIILGAHTSFSKCNLIEFDVVADSFTPATVEEIRKAMEAVRPVLGKLAPPDTLMIEGITESNSRFTTKNGRPTVQLLVPVGYRGTPSALIHEVGHHISYYNLGKWIKHPRWEKYLANIAKHEALYDAYIQVRARGHANDMARIEAEMGLLKRENDEASYLVEPYLELFSDLLAVVALENPNVVRDDLVELNKLQGDGKLTCFQRAFLPSPEEIAMKRDPFEYVFRQDLLGITRRFIGSNYLGKNIPRDVLVEKVLIAISKEISRRLDLPKDSILFPDLSREERIDQNNRALIAAIKREIGQLN